MLTCDKLRRLAGVVCRDSLTLIRAFMLFVDDDDPYILKRRKQRGTGTDNNIHITSCRPEELVIPLSFAHPGI